LACCLKLKDYQFGGEEEAEWVIRLESDYHHPLLPKNQGGGWRRRRCFLSSRICLLSLIVSCNLGKSLGESLSKSFGKSLRWVLLSLIPREEAGGEDAVSSPQESVYSP